MKHSMGSKVQFVLYGLLIVALAGCGANKLGLGGSNNPGGVSAKLAFNQGAAGAKAAAKTVAGLPAGVTQVQVTVTGTGADGQPIPVVRGVFGNVSSATVSGIYPGKVTLAVKAFVGNALTYEGFAIGVPVASNATSHLNKPIKMYYPQEKTQDVACIQCHETTLDTDGQNLGANFKQSAHYTVHGYTQVPKNGATDVGCAGCHGTSHNDPVPSTSGRCFECHGPVLAPSHKGNATLIVDNNCKNCHYPHNVETFVSGRCVACHSVGQDATAEGSYVNDNNGVRSITNEFSKWSHHVTGVTLNDAHCAACHLEGKVNADGEVVVDTTKHMADAKTHLRNADTDADMQWDPANPSFTTMDNFCLSCHDANGATSAGSQAIQAAINAKGINAEGKLASASNPFGDTISNQYDKMERPAVVDAAGQFATGNTSHHAVLGKRYSGRTRAAVARQIASPATFAANSSATLPGARSTIYDAGKFQSDYVTLADAAGEPAGRNGGTTLGDDSTLHCGDCHTVGQYRQADVGSRYNKAVIGAHGSNNEYLLRNNAGTDARHMGVQTSTSATAAVLGYGTNPYLVCYNCHAFNTYGVPGATGIGGVNHIGEYSQTNRCNGPQNTIFGNMTGEARLRSIVTQTSSTSFGKQSATFSNAFGIQCANCHNSGISANNIFGGIHGSKDATYTDGMGNTVKHQRFLPGLGNVMYVPGTLGGFTGGTTATFNSYSGNRDGVKFGNMTGQTFTLLPVRGVVAGTTTSTTTTVDGVTVPVTNAYGYTATTIKTGSYQYVTGGVSSDLNWEQKSVQPISGQFDFGAQAMGCYTLGSGNGASRNNSAYQKVGVPGTPVAAAGIQAGQKGPDGTTNVFDNWGGCDDHDAQQAGGDHRQFRKVLRKVTY
ncbi:hypothetical protein GMST_28890 [Geomonas silvestris]|uniref:Cytochrome c n=1 Tax=Geomonas silvestris TaxID=2740184 RepID=A0A6V8MKV2_9BACT|nr:hypothetical protein [Geomonas silvestris]GFO60564.1 hypothetical protein GMST_28890 [Geomonas silvestris]